MIEYVIGGIVGFALGMVTAYLLLLLASKG